MYQVDELNLGIGVVCVGLPTNVFYPIYWSDNAFFKWRRLMNVSGRIFRFKTDDKIYWLINFVRKESG